MAGDFKHYALGLHPAIIDIAYAVFFLLSSLLGRDMGNATAFVMYQAAGVVFLSLVLFWYFSLYAIAHRVFHGGGSAQSRSLGAPFLVSIAGAVSSIFIPNIPEAYKSVTIAVTLTVVLSSYILSMWLAASALTKAECSEGASDLAKTIGTFLLLVYLPLGVWFLQRRISSLIGRVPNGA